MARHFGGVESRALVDPQDCELNGAVFVYRPNPNVHA